MIFRQLFEAETSTYTYLLADPESGEAVLIDPVRETIERDIRLLDELGLKLVYTLETHVHADHVTASGTLRERLGSQSVVSREAGAACADRLVGDGDRVEFGDRYLEVRSTPGHTDGCVSYVLDDQSMVFTGDALLIRGTGRTDFQQGDAGKLYDSITTKLFTLPDEAAVYPGHDYRGHRASTVGEEKRFNPRVGGGRSREDFVEIMNNLRLAEPKHIEEAVPANLACGRKLAAELPVTRDQQGVPELEAGWVADHATGLRLVDVRGVDEWNEGHIEGSELAPLPALSSATDRWDKREPIVVVCRSGARSAMAALQLEAAGFNNVASLHGGVLAWAKQGRKLVR